MAGIRKELELDDNIQGMSWKEEVIVDEEVYEKYDYYLSYDYIDALRNVGYECSLYDKETEELVVSDYDLCVDGAVDRAENKVWELLEKENK